MTVAIASYQGREPLLRLLRGLDEQLAACQELTRDLEVLIVLDGSTDGSREAVEAQRWSVPVRVHWQPNRGRAAARNVGLEAAAGRLVWFLDDGLVPSAGLVARHRQAHTAGSPSVLVGPPRIPNDAAAPAALVRWWDSFYADLERDGVIDRFDRFLVSNTSTHAEVLDAVGGFDESFVEYGLEDYELGVRLLRTGITIRFDPEAVAWQPDVPPMSVQVARMRSIGLNEVRLAHLHPETTNTLFPVGPVSRPRRLLRKTRLRSPRALMALSHLMFGVSRFTASLSGPTAQRGEILSRAAAHAAGVAEGDPSGELLDRELGYSGRARPT
jgi:hypothetical protein